MRPEVNNAFGTIKEKIGDNNYAVTLTNGRTIEASFNRTDAVALFVVGDHVYLERVGFAQHWVIASHAFGDPAVGGGINWFQFDSTIGFDVGHLAP
ncbi:hypothetical protein LCGC14_0313550 [marine sediment metagenome]|uniref:Uncharacterized protein n=1 Tax=marine sediment metagenome TaxID=412755 RepID=A0A0F9WTD3_9ZZZZ